MSDRRRAHLVRLADLPGVACPCGTGRRAFADAAAGRASLHLVEVKQDTERHYRKPMPRGRSGGGSCRSGHSGT